MTKLTIIFLDRESRVVSSTVIKGKTGDPVPVVLAFGYSGYGDSVPYRFPEHDATFTRWLEGKPDRTDTASTVEVFEEDMATPGDLFKGDTSTTEERFKENTATLEKLFAVDPAHDERPPTKRDSIECLLWIVFTVCAFFVVSCYSKYK